jgi:Domain of unknown function (DUF5134)
VGGPGWLSGIFAALMLTVATYCTGRLLAARWWHRPTELDTDGAHIVMGVAMAGMLVPGLQTLPAGTWESVFAVGALWFGGQTLRARRGVTPAPWRCLHAAPHLVECAAMLYMFLLLPPSAAVRSLSAGMGGMGASANGSRFSHRVPGLGIDGDEAAVPLHNRTPRDVETETGAFPRVLGRVEGVERAGRYLRWHTRSGVADLDDDVLLLDPGRQPERPCAVHRIERVVDEIGPHLVELAGVSLDPGEAGAVVAHDSNTGTALVPQHHQAVEQADSPKLVGAHHIVAWLLIRSAFWRPRRCPGERLEVRVETSAADYIRAAHDLGRLR